MSPAQELWLGYGRGGRSVSVDVGAPGTKVLLLGSQSQDLAAIAALSAKESGASPIIFDLGGTIARRLSGRFETFDYRAFLYDSFRLEEPEAWHSQLAAAAYAAALDLSSEEEAIVNSAMQVVASDGSLLSPVSLHDVMGKVEGFRGFYVDKLNGRIGALRLFDAVDDQGFDRLAEGDLILDFHGAPYPQAGELSCALFLAKLFAITHARGMDPAPLIMTDGHRVFRAAPRPLHSNRLLGQLLEWTGTALISSSQPASLGELLLESCPVQVYASEAWHSQAGRPGKVLSGTFVLYDRRSGQSRSFFPRRISVKTGSYARAKAGQYPSPDLTRVLLEEIDRFPFSTPQSIVEYVAPEFLPADVSTALSSLERQGSLIIEPKESGSEGRVFSYTLSEKGRKLLEELRK